MERKMQNDLNTIQDWCLANELYINEDKTKIMMFRQKEQNKLNIFLHGEKCEAVSCDKTCNKLCEVSTIRYLGVEIDSRWAFDVHIDNIIKKLRQCMPKLYFLKKLLSENNKKIIYESWIKAHLLYALEVYGGAKAKELNRLQKIQNRIIKILFGKRNRFSTQQIFLQQKILKIKQLYEYNIIIKHFFSMKLVREDIINEKIHQTKNITFQPILTRNKYGEKLAKFYLPTIFNKLPSTIWTLNKYSEIKKSTKNYLLSLTT
jgi:hypothetical protein